MPGGRAHGPPLSEDARAEIMATADALAETARRAILPYFRNPALGADNKAARGYDPVTEADRAAEAAMRAELRRDRPRDGILGEELGEVPGESGLTWMIDPIDGTRAFLAGAPTWGVLIALCDDEGPFYGVIDQPYTGERFSGGLGVARMTGPHGARTLATRATRRIEDAILLTTFPEIGSADERTGFAEVAARARLVRYGLDCYAYALLAAGHVDLVIEAGLAPYDIAAPIAVIEAAGGVVTGWRGGPAHGGGRVLAAANAELHAAALGILSRVG